MSNLIEKNDLVSILIACYNGEKYIYNCLNSCVNQTYSNIEIIIINDGSTDNSKKIFEWWKTRDSRIKLINNENQGLSQTRNELIKYANGKYFTFLDIDDTLSYDSIEKMMNENKEVENDIVVGRTKFVYERKYFQKIPFIPSWRITKNMTNDHYVKSNICTPWASLIKKDYFKSLEIKFVKGRVFEDLGVMTFVFLSAKKFRAIKDIVYFYKRYKNKENSKNLSSFRVACFEKSNDVFWQIHHLLDHLFAKNLLNNKKQKRAVNGLMYQVIPVNIFLSTNLTKNKYYRYLINYDFIKMVANYGLYFKFSKTFWKSFAFFYIYLKNFQALKNVYKNKRWPFFINGYLKNNFAGYTLSSPKKGIRSPSRRKIYEISLDETLNYSIDNFSTNTNIALIIDEWDERIVIAIKIMQEANCVPFVYLKTKDISIKNIVFLQEETLGIIIDLRKINMEDFMKIYEILKNTKREKLIFVVEDKINKSKIDEIKNIINGVFWNE